MDQGQRAAGGAQTRDFAQRYGQVLAKTGEQKEKMPLARAAKFLDSEGNSLEGRE